MHCHDVKACLQRYVDGALDPMLAERLRVHLTTCDCCRAQLERLRFVEEALHAWPLVAEPADLAARVMAGVKPHPWVPRFRPSWTDLILSVCAAGLMGGAGLAYVALRLWQVPASTELASSLEQATDALRLRMLPLEMLQLEVALALHPLVESGALLWMPVLAGTIVVLMLAPLLWLRAGRPPVLRRVSH
jgi:anti-sigma factor RsiW